MCCAKLISLHPLKHHDEHNEQWHRVRLHFVVVGDGLKDDLGGNKNKKKTYQTDETRQSLKLRCPLKDDEHRHNKQGEEIVARLWEQKQRSNNA